MAQARPVPRLAADLALLVVAGFWGLTFPFGKLVLGVLPPFTYLAARFTLGAVLLVVGHTTAARESHPRRWGAAGAVGAVFFLGYAFQTVGLRLTTASKAAFITGLSVVLVPVIAALWLRRAPPPAVWGGIAAATAGLGLLSLDGPAAVQAGDLLVLAGAVCFALHIVLVGRLAATIAPPAFAAAQIVAVMALSTLAALPERPLAALGAAPADVWAMVAFMAATATVGALLVQTWAQRFTPPAHVGLMFTFEPVAAAIAAYLLLGEVLAVRQTLGALLILGGIVLAEAPGSLPATTRPVPGD
ncbi:MAG: DMT family transporter [Armatimonadota bacterium]|nr:DMT family transporter [Armatimonadota bacterium]MDR7453189.1 DMT family transporter [Armatimonadota bacterium]MDR7456849.1 DMT family transporter [Armatimonadota bacterium]MDR7495516.1 DMT family transporter [Armatimonadota bacterium]MDR7510393.1 DMT family transporter [Armatimonadota bacterium]